MGGACVWCLCKKGRELDGEREVSAYCRKRKKHTAPAFYVPWSLQRASNKSHETHMTKVRRLAKKAVRQLEAGVEVGGGCQL